MMNFIKKCLTLQINSFVYVWLCIGVMLPIFEPSVEGSDGMQTYVVNFLPVI